MVEAMRKREIRVGLTERVVEILRETRIRIGWGRYE